MTTEDPSALEDELREGARKSAVRAIMLAPLAAGVAMLAVLALTVGSLVAALGSGDGGGESGGCSESTACTLASIDAGTELALGSSAVQEYRDVLNALGSKCTNAPRRLGDMAVRSQEQLSDIGVEEDLLTILRDVEASIPTDAPRTDCDGAFASYVTVRGGSA